MGVKRSRYRPDVAAAVVSHRAMAQNPVVGLARLVAPALMGTALRGMPQTTAAAIVDDFTARGAAIERNERHKAAMLEAAEAKRQRKQLEGRRNRRRQMGVLIIDDPHAGERDNDVGPFGGDATTGA